MKLQQQCILVYDIPRITSLTYHIMDIPFFHLFISCRFALPFQWLTGPSENVTLIERYEYVWSIDVPNMANGAKEMLNPRSAGGGGKY